MILPFHNWRDKHLDGPVVFTRIRATWFVKLVLLVRILHNFKIEKVQFPGGSPLEDAPDFSGRAVKLLELPMCFRIWEQKQPKNGLGDF